jgi:hypothetical protein
MTRRLAKKRRKGDLETSPPIPVPQSGKVGIVTHVEFVKKRGLSDRQLAELHQKYQRVIPAKDDYYCLEIIYPGLAATE